jgi:flavin-dependent dehydrogenase
VGAGPAGSVAAYTAAKLGLKTLLIEKEKLPRYKPCGGGLTLKSIDFLKTRNLFDSKIVERKFKKIKFFMPKKELIVIKWCRGNNNKRKILSKSFNRG